jgi:hypothetical protein
MPAQRSYSVLHYLGQVAETMDGSEVWGKAAQENGKADEADISLGT